MSTHGLLVLALIFLVLDCDIASFICLLFALFT